MKWAFRHKVVLIDALRKRPLLACAIQIADAACAGTGVIRVCADVAAVVPAAVALCGGAWRYRDFQFRTLLRDCLRSDEDEFQVVAETRKFSKCGRWRFDHDFRLQA